MINPIYDGFPDHITVGSIRYPIQTDYRLYIMLLDGIESDDDEKKEKALEGILGNIDASDPNLIIQSFKDFLTRKELKKPAVTAEQEEDEFEAERNARPHYSFMYDFSYILSAFWQVYQIDLTTIPYLHWWKFMALFEGLPEDTEIKQMMKYRGINVSEIKSDEERKRIMQIQRSIMLPEDLPTDEEIGDAFW